MYITSGVRWAPPPCTNWVSQLGKKSSTLQMAQSTARGQSAAPNTREQAPGHMVAAGPAGAAEYIGWGRVWLLLEFAPRAR